MKYLVGAFLNIVGIILIIGAYSKITIVDLGIIIYVMGMGLWFEARINKLKHSNNLNE